MADPRIVLSVWAHPDDETYLAGGLMARAVRQGSRVVCVTATRGENGSPDESRWPSGAPLAAVRTKELEDALAVLGITEHHWLDYADGGVSDVPEEEGVRRIAALMDDVQPDTVLTFGPDGMTGHPDHITVGRWTTLAFEQGAPAGATLHYATHTAAWLDRFRAPLDALNVFMGAEPPATAPEDLSFDGPITGDLLDLKVEALQQMVSQVGPLVDALGVDFLREGLAEEVFRQAASRA